MAGRRAGLAATLACTTFALLFDAALAQAPQAPALSQRELQVAIRALGFLVPPASDGWVAVVFSPSDPASRQDAERVAALFGEGLRAGNAVLRARPVAANALAGDRYAALIAAAGAPMEEVMVAARAGRVACITAVLAEVEAGRCTIWVRSEPRVEVAVSRAAVQAGGLGLTAAFRMMVREF